MHMDDVENDRKRSIEGEITQFHVFVSKTKSIDIVGNEYGIDISVILKMVVVNLNLDR